MDGAPTQDNLLAGQNPNCVRGLVGLDAYGTAVTIDILLVTDFSRLGRNLHDGLLRYRAQVPLEVMKIVKQRKKFGPVAVAYRLLVLCLHVTEALDVVEDEPDQGYDHQDNKGNGHKEHGCSARKIGGFT